MAQSLNKPFSLELLQHAFDGVRIRVNAFRYLSTTRAAGALKKSADRTRRFSEPQRFMFRNGAHRYAPYPSTPSSSAVRERPAIGIRCSSHASVSVPPFVKFPS